jgi:hypothetical protein
MSAGLLGARLRARRIGSGRRPKDMRSLMRKVVAAVVGAALTVALSAGSAQVAPAAHPAQPTKGPWSLTRLARPAPASCVKKAPPTAAGYAAMFAALPITVWGAADGSISVKVGARSGWLYGDTFSTGRFAHSTAITQDHGCLHVSHGGAQLLPNDNATHIYWIESAVAVSPTRVDVRARTITLTGTKAWAFKDGGFDRTAVTQLNAAGDLTFAYWGAKAATPVPDPGPMYLYGPHHFGYGRRTHPELKLAGGRMLVTTAQNWDDGVLHPTATYRPLFTER